MRSEKAIKFRPPGECLVIAFSILCFQPILQPPANVAGRPAAYARRAGRVEIAYCVGEMDSGLLAKIVSHKPAMAGPAFQQVCADFVSKREQFVKLLALLAS